MVAGRDRVATRVRDRGGMRRRASPLPGVGLSAAWSCSSVARPCDGGLIGGLLSCPRPAMLVKRKRFLLVSMSVLLATACRGSGYPIFAVGACIAR
jgi:hypothetical protein